MGEVISGYGLCSVTHKIGRSLRGDERAGPGTRGQDITIHYQLYHTLSVQYEYAARVHKT